MFVFSQSRSRRRFIETDLSIKSQLAASRKPIPVKSQRLSAVKIVTPAKVTWVRRRCNLRTFHGDHVIRFQMNEINTVTQFPFMWNRHRVRNWSNCTPHFLSHGSKLNYFQSGAYKFTFNSKVVPRSVVNPDFLEPLNCKGLFTTHAITQSPNKMSLVKSLFGRMATIRISSIFTDEHRQFPERNSGPGLIGIGLASKLRTLSQYIPKFTFNSKVVPRSVVNPDFLEPLNCKGLFTTHAITQSLNKMSLVKSLFRRMATIRISSILTDEHRQFPERNSGPGLIGIGLASKLRTLFYEK